MTEIVIDNKKYVFIPAKSYQALQKKAALKTRPEKTLTLEQARAHSKKQIQENDTPLAGNRTEHCQAINASLIKRNIR